jgi:hypothetical protein
VFNSRKALRCELVGLLPLYQTKLDWIYKTELMVSFFFFLFFLIEKYKKMKILICGDEGKGRKKGCNGLFHTEGKRNEISCI